MSTYFSTIIKAGNQLREFNFRLLAPTDPFSYAVDIPGENGERIRFHLVQENSAWTITTAELPTVSTKRKQHSWQQFRKTNKKKPQQKIVCCKKEAPLWLQPRPCCPVNLQCPYQLCVLACSCASL
jgi:hypothetical protein